jgi:hypothetical protein
VATMRSMSRRLRNTTLGTSTAIGMSAPRFSRLTPSALR